MKTQQQRQAYPARKLAIAILGVMLPLATLSASLPATAHGHFFGLSLGRSSDSDRSSMQDRHTNSEYNSGRHQSHRFFFVDEHLFERYYVFYRLDNDSPWLKGESYRSRLEAELEVRRLEHNGYIAKLVRE
jgi:hypothetical protein